MTELRKTWGIEFFAKPRRNMKNHLLRLNDKLLPATRHRRNGHRPVEEHFAN
jgi:hypothetical protein